MNNAGLSACSACIPLLHLRYDSFLGGLATRLAMCAKAVCDHDPRE